MCFEVHLELREDRYEQTQRALDNLLDVRRHSMEALIPFNWPH